MAKKFKDRLRKHKTGPKSGFDRNWRIFEQFWANLGQFGSIWAILSPLESLESTKFEKKSTLGQKIHSWAQKAQNWPKIRNRLKFGGF